MVHLSHDGEPFDRFHYCFYILSSSSLNNSAQVNLSVLQPLLSGDYCPENPQCLLQWRIHKRIALSISGESLIQNMGSSRNGTQVLFKTRNKSFRQLNSEFKFRLEENVSNIYKVHDVSESPSIQRPGNCV